MDASNDLDDSDLRIIETARTLDEINKGALAGFRPLVKCVEPSSEIRSKFTVWQHKESGAVMVMHDFRDFPADEEWEEVIGWTDYYPDPSPEPFAAYLIPADLKVGERVLIEDLIEDFVGGRWNQGDAMRLDSCEAIWTGTDFDIQYDPDQDQSFLVG